MKKFDLPSHINVLFRNPDFFPLIIRKQFSDLDYLSFIGGSLGLLVGMSLLSFVEIIYYATFHLLVKYFFFRDLKIHPKVGIFKAEAKYNPTKVLKKADILLSDLGSLKESSLNIIADVQSSLIERQNILQLN